MRHVCASLFCILLVACGGQNEIDSYIAQVKARQPIPIEPLPELRPFFPMEYRQQEKRSPFAIPKPEVSAELNNLAKRSAECHQVMMTREKEILESYSLASLTMQGTLGKAGQLWALIKTPDGQSIRVGLNQYIGLNQGRIVKITNNTVDLLESVLDGKGCWVIRETQLAMADIQEKK